MDMMILSVFLIGAIVYARYNNFKAKRESEERYILYRDELEKQKRRVMEEELLNK